MRRPPFAGILLIRGTGVQLPAVPQRVCSDAIAEASRTHRETKAILKKWFSKLLQASDEQKITSPKMATIRTASTGKKGRNEMKKPLLEVQPCCRCLSRRGKHGENTGRQPPRDIKNHSTPALRFKENLGLYRQPSLQFALF
jgi:hypothetical protein